MTVKKSPYSVLQESPLITWTILVGCLVMIFATTLQVPYLGAGSIVIDFDAFYIAGQMVWNGSVADAYDAEVMTAAQSQYSDIKIFMPWTYPPAFNLLVALFPLASRGIAYLVFTGSTFLAYFFILRRLAGGNLPAVLLAILPALFITIRVGQNGFLIGALAGLFCIGFLQKKAVAGVPLGLMLVKPHLSIGMGVLVVFSQRWRTLAVTLLVVCLASIVATVAFGVEVWPAFLSGAQQASGFLERGLYPLFRMTSVYAALHSFGVSPEAALFIQIVFALAALGAVLYSIRANLPSHLTLGITLLASLMISPYNYDYDMPILGVGLALLIRDILFYARPLEKLALLIFSWIACGWGLFILLSTSGDAPATHLAASPPVSLGGIGYTLFIGLIFFVLRRIRQAGNDIAPK